MLWPITRSGFSNPFGDITRLQKEMNRLFNDAGSSSERFPAVNIWSDDDKLELTAEIPGVHPDDLNITVLNDQLTLEGDRKMEVAEDERVYHRRERDSGKFIRSFRLPYAVDNAKIEAKCVNGVLKMTLPRAEVTKPKKISISAG